VTITGVSPGIRVGSSSGGSGGEGPWYGTGDCGYVWLGDVQAGDKYAIWADASEPPSVTGTTDYDLRQSGGGVWYLYFTESASGVEVYPNSCSYIGLTMHQVPYLVNYILQGCG
jgi:hypothetical protein